MGDQVVTVSEFVALLNQTLEFAYPTIRVEGEVSGFKISKNRWVYFNITDENSSVRVFGTVYQLQQPIEDGMTVVVKGSPRLHNKYGLSLNATSILPSGEGDIKRAFELLKAKLEQEGLFEVARKRPLPEFPSRIGLITSAQAAAYSDFLKIVNQSWSGLEILHADVQVQGDAAPSQIVAALKHFSESPNPVEVIVITRGGGATEDLQAFSTEEVARAVAGSRIPTIVGVGHEIDISLADLAADARATTPTNAAQLVVADKAETVRVIDSLVERAYSDVRSQIASKEQVVVSVSAKLTALLARAKQQVDELSNQIDRGIRAHLNLSRTRLDTMRAKLAFMNPENLLAKGYSIVSKADGKVVRDSAELSVNDLLMIRLYKGQVTAEVCDDKDNKAN